jgi:single-strand DNA-binding protein
MPTRIPTTQVGNIGYEPEFGVSQNEIHWARFSLAVTDRIRNPDTKEWSDGKTVFHQISVFGRMADNVRESLHKGDRVIVAGNLEFREWQDPESGEKRNGHEIVATSVGPSLEFRPAQIDRTARTAIPERAMAVAPRVASGREMAPAEQGGWPTAIPGTGASDGSLGR